MSNHAEVFDNSYWRTMPVKHGDRGFIDAFYERLLRASDEIRAQFADTNFEKQKQVLMLSLAFMSAYAASGETNAVIEKIARTHGRVGLDIRPELYDIWLACLIETVGDYDPHWSPEVETAWRKTLEPGIAFMKTHREG